jgi:hypothetical protein
MRMRLGGAVGAAITVAVLAALPATANAQGFGCAASALRGTVLGVTALEPAVANGGATNCRAVTATGNSLNLPAPLQATTVAAATFAGGPAERVDQQVVGAAGAVGDLRVPLPAVPLQLPDLSGAVASIPAAPGLPTLPVPLPELPLPVQVPDVGTVDLRPALLALLPRLQLPQIDLLRVGAATAQARARCVDGRPALDGASEVTGLNVLGQDLPVGEAVERAVTLIDSSSVDPSAASLDLAVLPAGVTLTDDVRAALQAALDALPPIQIPATLAQVKVTPNQRSGDADQLLQQALHVEVSLLGRSLADLVIGEAAVSAVGVDCSPAAAAHAAQLECTRRRLVLADVVERGDKVRLVGAADRSLAGRRVRIVFTGTRQTVATATVKRDGGFATTSRLPRRSLRGTNRERFQAVLGRERSLDLKLRRRMLVSRASASRGRVTIVGRVVRPLARPARSIEVRRRVSCNRWEVVKRVRPDRRGRFRVRVAAPPGQLAGVYRLATRVRKTRRNPKTYATFTLPQAVAF